MKTEILLITPQIAEKLLAGNTSNRAMSEKRVDNLARQMSAGDWMFNGDSIRVSTTGRLLDGQHRLSAIVKSGKPQKFILISGLSDDVFTTIDVGAARTASDFLAIEGFKNTSNLSATTLLVMHYERCGNPFNKPTGAAKTSKKELVDFCLSNPEIAHFSSVVDNRKKLKKIFSPSATAFCLYVFSKDDPVRAELFMTELEDGYYSYEESPIAALRDRLILTSSAGSTTKKLGTALIFKAWQMYKIGAKSKLIRLATDESKWFLL